MIALRSRRGQPLLALLLVLGGWVSARAVMWQPPADAPAVRIALEMARMAQDEPVAEASAGSGEDARFTTPPAPYSPIPAGIVWRPLETSAQRPQVAAPLLVLPKPSSSSGPWVRPTLPLRPSATAGPSPPPGTRSLLAAGHQLLWMAALSRTVMPLNLEGLAQGTGAAPLAPAGLAEARQSRPGRWSIDGWVLWRRGGPGAPAGGLLIPSYGASQAGAVLRYRLAPDSGHRPALYLRGTSALGGPREREAALGLTLRPVARLPLALAGEARLTSASGGTYVRPAVYAVTELAPFALPAGLKGELYVQGGYVGGRFATGFADGQLRVDRRLAALGKGELRLGGGVWGGIQKGASRLDAGPSLVIGQPLGGPAAVRLAADWRFRVAGKALPQSGPAVTLSAGF
jgi:hypothetical protein